MSCGVCHHAGHFAEQPEKILRRLSPNLVGRNAARIR
jgi:hypothetical protein